MNLTAVTGKILLRGGGFAWPQVKRAEPSNATAPVCALTNQPLSERTAAVITPGCYSYISSCAKSYEKSQFYPPPEFIYMEVYCSKQQNLLPCSLEDCKIAGVKRLFHHAGAWLRGTEKSQLFKHEVLLKERQHTPCHNICATLPRSASWHLHCVPSSAGRNLERTRINHCCCSQIPLCDPAHTTALLLWHE